MFQIVGIVVLIAMVFGGFVFTGGNLTPVLHALPHASPLSVWKV